MDTTELRLLDSQVRAGRVSLFHGGAPDLRPGGWILPPSLSGMPSMRERSEAAGFTRVMTSEDLVYVTTERALAAAFAADWTTRMPGIGRGWLYRVDLEDHELVLDDDLPRGPFISFQLPRVRVSAVLDRGVDPNDRRHVRELRRFVALIA
ncbi:hypothetical protein ITJ43_12040 [Microbacterium sp. VKM Ac-2870]|uniref:hypothetical protein n=1 Tax=Microbacterium sp. VKM Ac-2870 TaxID=2783825 RepID=UPI00188B4743|nr:hypothetical protein [Microbacterium sp. VKM Ac-2870]MBF4562865.1 hypothetical protein [Microbacterium sp. VKM Ac-2870]